MRRKITSFIMALVLVLTVLPLMPMQAYAEISYAAKNNSELVKTVLGPGIDAVTGSESARGDVKFFDGGAAQIGIESGIVLTTANTSSTTIDPDLDKVIKEYHGEFNNGSVAVVEFTLYPDGTMLNFEYAFASCEFDQQEKYNDIFGLFVRVGDGTHGEQFENIAYLDNGKGITITNLKNGASGNSGSKYYHPEPSLSGKLGNQNGCGVSNVFTARKHLDLDVVQNHVPVTIKFAISDVGDSGYDSAVFIKKDSLSFHEHELYYGVEKSAKAPVADENDTLVLWCEGENCPTGTTATTKKKARLVVDDSDGTTTKGVKFDGITAEKFVVKTEAKMKPITYYKEYYGYNDPRNRLTTTATGATSYGGIPTRPGAYVAEAVMMVGETPYVATLHYDVITKGDSPSNYNHEELGNHENEAGEVVKPVSGESTPDGDVNQDVKVYLNNDTDRIIAYKIADIPWRDEDGLYLNAKWVDTVDTWTQSYSYKTSSEQDAFDSPADLDFASQKIWDSFYGEMAKEISKEAGSEITGLTSVVPAVEEGEPYSTLVKVGVDEEGNDINKYVTTLPKLTFGQWLVIQTSGQGGVPANYKPMVVNVFPERNETGYTIATVQEATMKERQTALVKKINGRMYDTVATGDIVHFTIEFDKPDFSGDKPVVLVDTMSKAFSVNVNDLNITYTLSDETNTLIKNVDYTLEQKPAADGSVVYTFTFNKEVLQAKIGTNASIKKLYIIYDATVTDKVEYNSSENYNDLRNYNKVSLRYGDNHFEDAVYGFTYGLNIVKLNGSSASEKEDMSPLANAKFGLYREMTVYLKTINEEDDSEVITWKGNYNDRRLEVTREEVEEGYDDGVVESTEPEGGLDSFKTNDQKYYIYEDVMAEDGRNEFYNFTYSAGDTIIRVFERVTKGSGIEDGVITSIEDLAGKTVQGIKEGNYILSEITPPPGYNRLAEDIFFTIGRISKDEAELKYHGTLSAFYELDGSLNESGRKDLVVVNYKGMVLPSTGGMGTIIFIIIGMVLMSGVIVLLVKKRNKQFVD